MNLFEVVSAEWLPLLLAALFAYLLGSISPAILVGRLFAKTDIRTMGSGNAGATCTADHAGRSDEEHPVRFARAMAGQPSR